MTIDIDWILPAVALLGLTATTGYFVNPRRRERARDAAWAALAWLPGRLLGAALREREGHRVVRRERNPDEWPWWVAARIRAARRERIWPWWFALAWFVAVAAALAWLAMWVRP